MEKGYVKEYIAQDSDIVFSKAIKAGKRIYYFDVKRNRKNELFLSITESKKIIHEDQPQSFQFEKFKIFLYKEDFNKFMDAMEETLDYIQKNNTIDFPNGKTDLVLQKPIKENLEAVIE